MTRTFTAIALALALVSTASAAPRAKGKGANAACSAIGSIYQAVVKAKQSGTSEEAMNKLASTIDDAQAAGETKEVIEKVYKSNEFDHVPPQTARALFQASCKLANS